MALERGREQDGARRGAGTRCPACGRRVLVARPLCPIHGPVPVTASGDEAPASLPRFPGYRTLRVIGRGGFGTVLAVEPEAGGPLRAVKLAHAWPADAGRRLAHEIAVLRDVGPPHVPAVHGSGLLGGSPYVVMDYEAAPTLADLLVEGPLSPGDAMGLAGDVLRALHAVHARGFAHLDLKPENVFALPDAARIVDFGLVAAPGSSRSSAASTAESTRVEVAAGTAEYMAPEQCEHREEVDTRADIYAMGVILHELTAGAPPFWGPPAVVREAHLSRRPPRLSTLASGVPPALEEIVLRCLAKDPHDRFESAAALGVALAEVAPRAVATPTRRPPTAPAAPATRDERRTVGLLFFESHADVLALQHRLATLGGQLAHASGGRCVAIYALGDNPARSARRAAHELLRDGFCERVRLDVAAVSVQLRADGSKRYLSPIFGRRERFPAATDPPGVSQTPAAGEVLTDAEADAAVGRDELVASLVRSARRAVGERSPTVVRVVAGAGHGKSHLLRVLGERLAELDPAVTTGETQPVFVMAIRAPDPALGGADGVVRELLQRTLDLPAVAPVTGGEARIRAALDRCGVAEAAPAVAVALGWVAMDAPRSDLDTALGSGLRTLEAAPGALRSALTTAAAAALRWRAAQRPVLVLLDDAHQADESALAALEYAALAEGGAPLWICAFARPVFDEEHPDWGERASQRERTRSARSTRPARRGCAGACCSPPKTSPTPPWSAWSSGRRASRSSSSSSPAASAARGSSAGGSAATRTTWPPTSWTASPICPSSSGRPRARSTRSPRPTRRTRGWRRCSATRSPSPTRRACCAGSTTTGRPTPPRSTRGSGSGSSSPPGSSSRTATGAWPSATRWSARPSPGVSPRRGSSASTAPPWSTTSPRRPAPTAIEGSRSSRSTRRRRASPPWRRGRTWSWPSTCAPATRTCRRSAATAGRWSRRAAATTRSGSKPTAGAA